MRGGQHGHVASGLDAAIKRWERFKSDRGGDAALRGLVSNMDDGRTVRILRHVTDTHSFDFDIDGAEYESVHDLCDKVCRSANWSKEQLGDAIVRAADVGDVHDSLDRVEESAQLNGRRLSEADTRTERAVLHVSEPPGKSAAIVGWLSPSQTDPSGTAGGRGLQNTDSPDRWAVVDIKDAPERELERANQNPDGRQAWAMLREYWDGRVINTGPGISEQGVRQVIEESTDRDGDSILERARRTLERTRHYM